MNKNEMVELALSELPQCSSFRGYPNTRLEEFLKSGARKFFAYKIGDEYVGGCALIIKEGQFGHFSDFCVREDWRGKGIGSCILKCAIDHFKDHGIKTVRLHVFKDNPAEIRLYERFGFRVFEEINPGKIAMIKTL